MAPGICRGRHEIWQLAWHVAKEVQLALEALDPLCFCHGVVITVQGSRAMRLRKMKIIIIIEIVTLLSSAARFTFPLGLSFWFNTSGSQTAGSV